MQTQMPAGLRFSLLSRAVRKRFDEAVRAEGLTGVQLFVLCQLREREESGAAEIRQRDLEAVCRVTHPTMTEILRRLENKGYVRCTRSEIDRRSKRISSTDKADGLRERMDEADRRAFAMLCEGLDETERDTLLRLTDRMAANARTFLGKGCEDDCD